MRHPSPFLCLLVLTCTPLFAASDLASITIQHEGRFKPLDSFARLELLAIYERRSLPELSAIDWLEARLLDSQTAGTRRIFRIRHRSVLEALDIPPRDDHRYSYRELAPALAAQEQILTAYLRRNPASLSLVEHQLTDLFLKVTRYHAINLSLSAFLPQISIDNAIVAEHVNEPIGTRISYFDLLQKRHVIQEVFQTLAQDPNEDSPEDQALRHFGNQFHNVLSGRHATALTIIPPDNSPSSEWLSPWDLLLMQAPTEAQQKALNHLNAWVKSRLANQTEQATEHSQAFKAAVTTLAQDTVAPWRIQLEIWDNQADLFYRSVVCYLAALLLIGISWGKSRILRTLALLVFMAGILCHLWGLIDRILIMARPPVSSLYESILFVSLIGVIGCVLLELIRKNGIGLLCGTILGGVLQLIGFRYAIDGDTKGMLVAVLNSNFWLSTHVITITTGYGCTLVAGLTGHVYLIKRWLRPNATTELKELSNTLGALALIALFFTLFGTILGGIWADQSWGRFWGWDPKENGALLIVLWLLLILHGRIAKQLSPLAFASGLVLANVCVALAWFGVNLLSVGLHSYGFTENIALNLLIFCSAEIIFALGGYVLVRYRENKLRTVNALDV